MDTYKGNKSLESLPEASEHLAAMCHNGTFVGRESDAVICFRGIPFAKPPVGEFRWKEPQPVEPGEGIYEAYYNAKSPIQTEVESERASFYEQGEDCLYLNVWTASGYKDKKRPVMVFIHGGSYGWGGTADPLYDGKNFVKAHPEIVLVCITYRLGITGFVDFSAVPGGEEYRKSGNLGLLDLVCALGYIQENIAAFGGDKDNVTIWGESAGAGAVSLLPLIPKAKGLFHRIIAESGSVALTSGKDQCLEFTKKLLKLSGAKSMKGLLALSEEELREINEKVNIDNNFPERDGIVIPEDLYAAYERGISPDIDILIGTNANELRYWISEFGSMSIYKILSRVLAESHKKFMTFKERAVMDGLIKDGTKKHKSKTWAISELYDDIFFRIPSIRMAGAHAKNGGNVYMYFWEKESDIPDLKACHAVELSYVLNNLHDTIYTGNPADPELAGVVQEMWVNFAKTGDPGTKEIIWKKYDDSSRYTMVLGDKIYLKKDRKTEREKKLLPMLKYHFSSNRYFMSFNIPFVYKALAGLGLSIAGISSIIAVIIRKRKK